MCVLDKASMHVFSSMEALYIHYIHLGFEPTTPKLAHWVVLAGKLYELIVCLQESPLSTSNGHMRISDQLVRRTALICIIVK